MTVKGNGEAPVQTGRPKKGLFTLAHDWKAGDTVQLTMPMHWRFVRGRETQAGRVALLRGPMVFCIGKDQNTALFQTFPSFRDLTVDPSSIGEPVPDDSVRQGGLKVSARAWTTADCTGDKVSVVFTEFADPSGREVYFKVPDAPAVIPLVDDEIMTL